MEPEDMPEEMFERLRHMFGGHKHKVVKTIKPTEDEVLEYMALRGFGENAKKAVGVHNSKKQLFWSKVELRTSEVTRTLRWNDKDQVIEVIECDHNNESGKKDDWES